MNRDSHKLEYYFCQWRACNHVGSYWTSGAPVLSVRSCHPLVFPWLLLSSPCMLILCFISNNLPIIEKHVLQSVSSSPWLLEEKEKLMSSLNYLTYQAHTSWAIVLYCKLAMKLGVDQEAMIDQISRFKWWETLSTSPSTNRQRTQRRGKRITRKSMVF
jgi:hypothetical protein